MKDIKSLIDSRITFVINSNIEYDLFIKLYIKYIKSIFKDNINIHTELNKNNKFSFKNYDICLNTYYDNLGFYFTNILNTTTILNNSKRMFEISEYVFNLEYYNNGIFYFNAIKNRYSNESDYLLDLNKFYRLNKLKYILHENS